MEERRGGRGDKSKEKRRITDKTKEREMTRAEKNKAESRAEEREE